MTTSIILLFSAIMSGLLTVFFLNFIVNSKMKGKIPENENPVTVDILKVILFLCGGLFLNEIVVSIQTLTQVLPSSFTGNILLLKEIMYFSIFLGLTLLTLILNIWFSAMMFEITSKGKNIFIEAANNNVNAIIIFCGIVLALTLSSKAGLTHLLDQFVPYPMVPNFH